MTALLSLLSGSTKSVTLILIIFLSFISLLVLQASASVEIFGPDEKPYNLTYADHAKNYWRWLLPIPAGTEPVGAENPVGDPTGKICAKGQSNSSSPVFYLAHNNGGETTERKCVVPAGKGLLIPVMEVEVSDKELPGPVSDLAATAKNDQDRVNLPTSSMYLRINDREYPMEVLKQYRINPTDAFEIVLPNNLTNDYKGLYGITSGGPTQVVADGYYILTKPLTKGTYSIHFLSTLGCDDRDDQCLPLVQDIKYTITAK
jgi:hypothetical protein